jgi:hypothetical protein
MDKVLPDLTDDEILVHNARRAAYLHKASKLKVDDINEQFSQYVETYFKLPSVDTLLKASDEEGIGQEVRINVVNIVKDQFVHVLTREKEAEIKTLTDLAYSVIPETIQAQKWSPDTCKCTLSRILDTSNPDITIQTYFVTKGPEHSTLELAELHDAVHAENQLKNSFQTMIHKEIPNGKDLEYNWSFDIDRKLVVDVTGKDTDISDAIKALGDKPEFIDKVIFRG